MGGKEENNQKLPRKENQQNCTTPVGRLHDIEVRRGPIKAPKRKDLKKQRSARKKGNCEKLQQKG